ncbi:MAG: histidinol-phosphate transaminase [Armatimonadota bacterium]
MTKTIDIKSLARKCIMDSYMYVAGKPIEEVKRELGLKEIIKLASNENPLGPSPKAVEAIKKSADQIHLYPDDHNYYLKQKLSKLHNLSPENFVIGNGSMQLFELICKTFIHENEEMVVANPTFRVFDSLIRTAGGLLKTVPLKNHAHDVDAMLAACTEKTKIIALVNPNNPTGTNIPKEEVERFINGVPTNAVAILDEAYIDFMDKDKYNSPEFLDKCPNLIILRSFSKIMGLAGLRIGYAITNKEVAQVIEKARMPFTVSLPAQVAAAASLDDASFREKSIKLVHEQKNKMYKFLESMNIEYIPSQANFIAVKLDGIDDKEFFGQMLKEGIIILAGKNMLMPGYIRVTLGTDEQMKKFYTAFEKIYKKLKKA